MYLLVAAIAVRIAVTGRRGADTPYAALDALAETEVGEAMLWVTAFGLGALTLWQVFETVWRRDPHENPLGKAFGRFGTIAAAVGYLTLAISAVRSPPPGARPRGTYLAGGRRVEPRGAGPEDRRGRRGLVLVVLAVRSGYRACGDASSRTCEMAPRIVVALGQAGLVGKGVTFAIIGGLMIWTALEGRLGPPGIQTVFRLVNLSPAAESSLSSRRSGLTALRLRGTRRPRARRRTWGGGRPCRPRDRRRSPSRPGCSP